jgi:hypothetical protein
MKRLHLAGIPPIALTYGELPGSEILFNRSLHELKAIFEPQLYLKNLSPPDIAAAQ